MKELTIAQLEAALAKDGVAMQRIVDHLASYGVAAEARPTAATLSAVCCVHERTWQKWKRGDRQMPDAAFMLIVLIAWPDKVIRRDAGRVNKSDIKS